ncbi:uncharacterized protein (DUF2235 family) [Bradyrhizobium japonicum USDA 38]|uniref:T6SS phospholipase effector Tle1-like catalytic domain-containing protein n=1 Tax=Bradyrhizobium japonicum TaxID=375 RepID=UPI0004010A8D|nr:DUF2235 domain-containing protein [Bradyrhizobium japonicum]MCS3896665.1 uncharacterized protein (DUF2235 family) [Bradyrhizobium japonicum USDA 38]MCS3949180.1 uncharacterized protein (DUF2235 family) [Bradyrhizobium japonicum]MCW2218137.1 uncharacterized protein (DUF2235 family) [Bradyrhizobium japonicum]MCW2342750.1 uncharacterized protein (DUF2235 family) [Bradyrhizobium japonicum]
MIFLFDGTANDASAPPNEGIFSRFSNVYAINQLIADRKKIEGDNIQTQITFYLPGIGTKFTVMDRGFLPKKWRSYLFGDGLEQLILRAYVNLSANYHVGDEIILIGFSRGAIAARIFSRLISDFGILSSDMLLNLDPLWSDFVDISGVEDNTMYSARIEELKAKLRAKWGKEVFHVSKDQLIRFLGVFDTVAGPRDKGLTKYIAFRDLHPAKGVQHAVHIISMHESRSQFELRRFAQVTTPTATIREIWLPGVHSDIGGGYSESLISNISLLTMCFFIRKLGGVALDLANYKAALAEVRTQVRADRFVVNPEPNLVNQKKRDGLVSEQDELHPLHWYLLNRQDNIFWKDGNLARRKLYVNRLGKLGKQATDLRHSFDEWISQA